jgi:hypothetical protein
MPEVGDAEPRPWYLATHEPAQNDGAEYVKNKNGTVVVPPTYSLTTSEKKRARVTAATLKQIADDATYASNPEAHPDYRTFEDIANGNLLTSRTRKGNRVIHKPFVDIWVDLENEPKITPKGTRRRNRLVTPCTTNQPSGAGVHDGVAAQPGDKRTSRRKNKSREPATAERKRKRKGQDEKAGLNTYDDNG